MPLNKLDNFIKNTEGRIIYVSPADLDSTDSIDNQGNSLARPFKTIQRAIIEAARFSYLKGDSNDLTERTTILLMPGEHIVDNRPGYKISATNAFAPGSDSGLDIDTTFNLDLNSNFDLNQEENVLYRFNSVHGGVVVPRGTSIVGLDLRKTKIRPKYVPNPTDSNISNSAIFRITGAGYYWQFSVFDGDELGLVYTDPTDFSNNNRSKPTFSHHKLTIFEYADGVNNVTGYDITDLDMYYAKLSRAYGLASGRNIDDKYPTDELGFAKQRPEWEIVGAFANDAINISSIISGDGTAASNTVTVTTSTDHNLSVGTPIKIRGVSTPEYNVSTSVASVDSTNSKIFTYILSSFPQDLDASPNTNNATVTIETDTVSGASPYIFNVSMRSVWGMNGMHADGSKADGFKSMVVAQFTGISLQKDDRSFVKYSETSRNYEGIAINVERGATLSQNSSSTNQNTVYHLDSGAIYRSGWEQTHIKISNKAVVQIVSVFAIGYSKHFEALSGGDASITNSNSNFGQLSLISSGFRDEAFDKDNKGYITHVIPPRAINNVEEDIDWLTIDIKATDDNNQNDRLYLSGFDSEDVAPSSLTQGFRIGAKTNDKLYVNIDETVRFADIKMPGSGSIDVGGVKETVIDGQPSSSVFTTVSNHGLETGEKIILVSDDGDLPENIESNTVYFAIKVSNTEFKAATSKSDADNDDNLSVYLGTNLRVLSRVSDKESGDVGSPIQWDTTYNQWYVKTNANSEIYTAINGNSATLPAQSSATFVKRIPDNRSLDEKIYKFRVVIPKELTNAKTPESGFIIQESSTTGVRTDADLILSTTRDLTTSDFDFERNPRFISTCSLSGSTVTVISEIPHNLNVNDKITILNAKDSSVNTVGAANSGFSGSFSVTNIVDDMTFEHSTTDVDGIIHTGMGVFSNDTYTADRETLSTLVVPATFRRDDILNNFYIYRNEVISEYSQSERDGIYHIYALSADYAIPNEFTNLEYGQNVVDLYPQLDRDNSDDDPNSAKSFALRSPLGKVETNDVKKSITKETADKLTTSFGIGVTLSAANNSTNVATFSRRHGIGGISGGTLDGGSGYPTNDTFYNVKLYNEPGLSTWNGATAKVVVSGGGVSSVEIMSPGSGYSDSNVLYFDTAVIGVRSGGSDATFTISSENISGGVGDVLEFTGIGTVETSRYRITTLNSDTQVTIGRTSGDPIIHVDQYAVKTGPSVQVSGASTVSGITSFTCTSPHGLTAGNRFKVTDSSNNTLGDYLVKSSVGIKTFTATTTNDLDGPYYILKHGYSANDKSSNESNENLFARGLSIYDDNTATIESGSSDDQFLIKPLNSGIGTQTRYPYGSYIQYKNEIMRIKRYTTGANPEAKVIRGVLGTKRESTVENGELVKKIKLLPVEFRRPSILRASGHTFEYLGYGPGNYSTGLPQVQNRTLTEREEFLSQAQERSAGTVVYTGMNNKGDFYIGNTKKSSATGEETTFDTPIPSVTGENLSRLSSVFDEVTIKERLVVEGGKSRQILSQFDGPVTFTEAIRIKNVSDFSGSVKVTNTDASTSTSTGALIVSGGVGIGSTLTADTIISNGVKLGTAHNAITTVDGGALDVDGSLTVSGDITAFFTSDERLKDNIRTIDDPLQKIISISGNTFDWNDKSNKFGHDVGLIAQEVNTVLPEAVIKRDDGYLAVDYNKVIPLLVEAVKDLSAKIDSLEQKLQDK
tara:strand:- start:589 stop:5712 length:5124 start_codon:yes stop_codon:yes gene_type:complete